MNTKRVLSTVLFVLVILALALPSGAVLARKQIFKAVLTTDAELHTVVGSSARGSAALTSAPDGSLNFQVVVRGLSGPAMAAHIHGPADASTNAGVLITLCGNPQPSAAGACVTSADGTLTIFGNISSSLLAQSGVTGAQFFDYLNSGLLYINVHTALNPAGEARGQLLDQ